MLTEQASCPNMEYGKNMNHSFARENVNKDSRAPSTLSIQSERVPFMKQ